MSHITPSPAVEQANATEHEPILARKPLGDVLIEVTDLCKSYELEGGEKVHALRGITMSAAPGSPVLPIRRGEFVMLRGSSGGGKTTLLNCVCTIDQPTSGALRLFGEEINFRSAGLEEAAAALRLRKIGIVFQTFNLLSTLSAFENVELPANLADYLPRSERSARAAKLLTEVGLGERMDHLPAELSGGEMQRVAIARALMNDPELIVLDEPTGDLDIQNTVDVMNLLLRINATGRTVLMVTHNPELECYADRILYLKDGRIVEQAMNAAQVPLVAEDYAKWLNERDTQSHHLK